MIDVQAMAADDFEELVFDGPDDFAPSAAPAAPTSPPATGRKRIARSAARQSPEPAEPPAAIAPAPEPAAPPPPTAEPVAPAAATLPAWLALAALAVGLLAAVLAAIGLLLATRTIAHADGEARSAERERMLLARVPASLARLDDIIAREQAALARLQDGRAGQPATIGDIHRELDGLRLALDRHQPQQDLRTVQVIQSGQGEIASRLGTMSDMLERLDRASRAAK